MIFWFKDSIRMPLYSLDARGGPLGLASHLAMSDDLGSRSYFITDDQPSKARLRIQNVSVLDEGVFRCRVDFNNSPTRNFHVNLTLVVQPSAPRVFDAEGQEIKYKTSAGPFLEDHELFLSCQVTGGQPRPILTWWHNGTILDSVVDSSKGSFTTVNQLVITRVPRSFKKTHLECKASSSEVAGDIVRVIPITVYLKPSKVKIVTPNNLLSVQKVQNVRCETSGSYPPAKLTWLLDGKPIRNAVVTEEGTDSFTGSILSLSVVAEDDGKDLVCRADNPRFPGGSAEDRRQIHVAYYGTFDFIIVGAGSAGCVLASRLSEIDDLKILLLEAGGYEDDFTDIPGMFYFLADSPFNWGYETTPQRGSCLGMKKKQCIYPRGKVVGGSSVINMLQYVRGNKEDYEEWVQLGNPGWSYQHVLPYFLKSENSEIHGDKGYHNKGGLLNVAHAAPILQTTDKFLLAHSELGLKVLDYNGVHQNGASLVQCNTKHGRRHSTSHAFLSIAKDRSNLVLETNALVTEIIIDKGCKVATGVIFTKNGRQFRAKSSKEVIISGGSINTPQLLMLSGIGPKDHLESLGIEVVQDLPVGKFLQDHPLFPGILLHTNISAPIPLPAVEIKHYLEGIGPLTDAGFTDGIGFTNLHENHSESRPVIQYIYSPPAPGKSDIFNVFNYDKEVIEKFLIRVDMTTDVLILIVLLHEKSIGSVTLKSRDPLDFPNIDLNFFSDPNNEDIETMYRGIQHVLKFLDTESFRSINASLLDYNLCTEHTKFSRDYWYCIIRTLTTHIFHPIRTTPMGPDPKSSVVNPDLMVHGISGLRVADCGVIPATVSGNTNAPTIMIAEKISKLIKEEYGYYD